jgi:hypothetical protein
MQGCIHMIDTLAGKIKELIIMKSDPSMMSWLQEWKRQTVDMEVESRFDLWEDENQGSEDVFNSGRPAQGVVQIPSGTLVQEGECIEELSQSTTSTCIRDSNSGTPLVFNIPPTV